MAFGGFKGRLTGTGLDALSSNDATGSVSVSVDDLVFVCASRFLNVGWTTCSDNLGNSYTALSAGIDGGNPTFRNYYSRVTTAGTLTTVSVACSVGLDFAITADVYEGAFDSSSPLDVTSETTTAD